MFFGQYPVPDIPMFNIPFIPTLIQLAPLFIYTYSMIAVALIPSETIRIFLFINIIFQTLRMRSSAFNLSTFSFILPFYQELHRAIENICCCIFCKQNSSEHLLFQVGDGRKNRRQYRVSLNYDRYRTYFDRIYDLFK